VKVTEKTDKYSCFSELAAREKEGEDYERVVRPRDGSSVAIIAPHAGKIEPKTDGIARDIAGKDFSFYCFCGLKKTGKNRCFHITSHNFDEPECLAMIASHQWVITIHGCTGQGERIFLGGLDKALINDLVLALSDVGILAETDGHEYTGTNTNNICNLGITKAGVQFELSLPFRKSSRVPAFVAVVREVLLQRQNGA
jgi:phage replication-related protein YjqB (UPF0714/DUF867 family)